MRCLELFVAQVAEQFLNNFAFVEDEQGVAETEVFNIAIHLGELGILGFKHLYSQ